MRTLRRIANALDTRNHIAVAEAKALATLADAMLTLSKQMEQSRREGREMAEKAREATEELTAQFVERMVGVPTTVRVNGRDVVAPAALPDARRGVVVGDPVQVTGTADKL